MRTRSSRATPKKTERNCFQLAATIAIPTSRRHALGNEATELGRLVSDRYDLFVGSRRIPCPGFVLVLPGDDDNAFRWLTIHGYGLAAPNQEATPVSVDDRCIAFD